MGTATLPDGRQVSTSSEEWRSYCEACTVLSWPLSRRRSFLYGKPNQFGRSEGGVLQRRGEAALKKLEADIRQIWQNRPK